MRYFKSHPVIHLYATTFIIVHSCVWIIGTSKLTASATIFKVLPLTNSLSFFSYSTLSSHSTIFSSFGFGWHLSALFCIKELFNLHLSTKSFTPNFLNRNYHNHEYSFFLLSFPLATTLKAGMRSLIASLQIIPLL